MEIDSFVFFLQVGKTGGRFQFLFGAWADPLIFVGGMREKQSDFWVKSSINGYLWTFSIAVFDFRIMFGQQT